MTGVRPKLFTPCLERHDWRRHSPDVDGVAMWKCQTCRYAVMKPERPDPTFKTKNEAKRDTAQAAQ